jgi:BirA family biotin operon repressor/biotin-[acetyl-CoA-carboxylase] ligase
LLYDRREQFVAMEELAEAASLSVRGLAGALEDLREVGHTMEVSPAQGVRLLRPVRLDARLVERRLGTRRVGRSVICFGEVDSTNDVAFEAARQRSCDGLVVLAEHQRRGRGRRGRRWQSPPGANVLMSVLLVDGALPQEAVTIAGGLAVAQGVEDACGARCDLKWPNDVCMDGSKVAGVLVEVRKSLAFGGASPPDGDSPAADRAEGGRGARRCVIVGVGINANASPPPAQLDRPATDLAAVTGAPVERIEVIRAVLRRLDHWTEEVGRGRLGKLHEAWVRRCGMLNQRAAVLSAGRRYVGRVLDVSPRDGLVLEDDEGQTLRLSAETSTLLP